MTVVIGFLFNVFYPVLLAIGMAIMTTSLHRVLL
jgi:hypothetical protein